MLTRAHVVFGDRQQVKDHTLEFGEVYGCGLVKRFLLLIMGFICMSGFV